MVWLMGRHPRESRDEDSGKGVFNISISLTGSNCAAGSSTSFQGAAIYDTPSRKLIAMGQNAGKTDGFFFIGTR